MSYVYIAPHAQEQRFKVGKSRTPLERISILERGSDSKFDLKACVFLKTKSDSEAYRLESIFHTCLEANSIKEPGFDGQGKTEWFYSSAWDKAIQLSDALMPVLGFVKEIPVITEMDEVKFSGDSGQQFISAVAALCVQERIRMGMTQKDLAIKANVSKRTVERMSKGGNINYTCFVKIINVLGLLNGFNDEVFKRLEVLKKDYFSRRRVCGKAKVELRPIT